VDSGNEVLVGSIGRLAGIAAFGLMMARLGQLVESGPDSPAWHLIMVASAFLGGVVWWLLSQTISNRKIGIGLYVVGGVILFLRIAVPDTLFAGFLPTPDTLEILGQELSHAIDVIRFGIAPVSASAGVVAILSALMWVNGGLYMWGATDGPVTAMVLPSLALYLEFAVMDRSDPGLGWMIAAAAVIGLAVLAVAMERREEAGRIRDHDGRPIARQTRATAVIVAAMVGVGAIGTVAMASDLVPAFGNLRWNLGSGYGPGYGGVSFDRLADLRQRIITRTNQVMFTAVLDENAPPPGQVYWRMEALDRFDGTAWRPSGVTQPFFQAGQPGGNPDHAYQGTTQQVAARVKIDGLRSQVVPTAGIAYDIDADLVNLSILQVSQDGSLIYQPGLNEGDEYVITRAVLPMSRQDLGALATGPNGELSPLFENASEAGLFDGTPASPPDGEVVEPADLADFVDLPDDSPIALSAIALAHTEGASTDFERAWLLQYWFRDSGDFTYSTTVTSGHDSLELVDWLAAPSSENYRTGYCEQFAAAMAVLGRSIGIPSRVVWGFTPGDPVEQADGTQAIVVRDNNAHAWVEMWMDGFGWVSFDPTPRGGGVLPASMTASFDPVEFLPPPTTPDFNPDGPNLNENPNLPESEILGGATPNTPSFPWEWLLVIPAAVIVIGGIPWLKSVRRRRRMAQLRQGDITAAWDEIVDRLTDLGQPVPPSETPMEFARRTDPSLMSLAVNYSATIYGDRQGMGTPRDLEVVEDWLRRRYEGGQRFKAAFSPRSLLRDD
jgi:transglutaminase-like putative cysteine protease